MQLQFYNTLSRKKAPFTPINADNVGLYSCGPTVYGRAHLGNMRAYLFADLLKRVLELAGYQVNHVMNITDVGHLTNDSDDGDDKLALGAKREQTTAWELAKRYEALFFADATALNIHRPTIVCRATDHIEAQINMIKTLEDKGYTYQSTDGVYFDSVQFPHYGELAHLDLEGLRGGERVELGGKKNKTDFALWKFSPADEQRDMEWDSPWGKGFPGWHIECSAMAHHYLGNHFDIHTGGTDHIPIHHTNEIAQSECALSQRPTVNTWMHCQFLVFPSGERVAKSSGHDLSIDGLIARGIDPLAYRYLCLTAHYRNFLNYTEEAIDGAAISLKRLRQHCQDLGYHQPASPDHRDETMLARYPDIFTALFDDLNSAKALALFWEQLKATSQHSDILGLIGVMDNVLGLSLSQAAAVRPQA